LTGRKSPSIMNLIVTQGGFEPELRRTKHD
jgi:hypothetical protein